MHQNTFPVVLMGVFLSRIMLPVTNGFYILSELAAGQGDLWSTFNVVNLFLEMSVVVAMILGIHSPVLRRVGSYVTFGLIGAHYMLIMSHVAVFSAVRQSIGPVYPVVLTVACAVTVVLGYLTLRSADNTSHTDDLREIDGGGDGICEKSDTHS